VCFVIERQRAADHVSGAAKLGFPESIAQDHDVLAAWRVLLRAKGASERRPGAHDLEEAHVDSPRLDRPCGPSAAEGTLAEAVHRRALERLRVSLPVVELSGR